MAAITVTASAVRPLNGSITRRYTAGASGNVGDLVYLATDGFVDPTDADALASSQVLGVVVAVNANPGATSFVSGDRVDVTVYGPVVWGTGMTIGGRVYNSPTAGAGDQTAPSTGDYPCIAGFAEAANVLFVAPQVTIPVVV